MFYQLLLFSSGLVYSTHQGKVYTFLVTIGTVTRFIDAIVSINR